MKVILEFNGELEHREALIAQSATRLAACLADIIEMIERIPDEEENNLYDYYQNLKNNVEDTVRQWDLPKEIFE